ncbi:transcriptional repressor [Demequina sp. B12]|uniref:Fur family transcriptional regulator n=1 Tax=Demequina sp. B12 TaxID=2992757 RepID=UPI00237B62EC|nr:Fur family transcriptional regulator [Demequina sp. B12]MDE0572113.1 transcriptional repressor [Demequina sp. B12]
METAQELDPRAMLRGAGLRVTEPRVAVVTALAHAPHSGADVVFSSVSETLPTTSRQAIYNVLNDITQAGIARRIEPAGQPGLYELRVGDNHHHIVCRHCGAISDVDCVTGHAPCLTPSTTNGFDLSEAEVTFWGLCATCKTATPPHPPIVPASPQGESRD